MTQKKKAIFLDRDGTIIIDKVYLNDVNQIEYLPGVFTAMRELRDAGYHFVIVTNQSGVARGLVTIENLQAIHDRIAHDMAREGIFFLGFYSANFSVESEHVMRKPKPGMLEHATSDHNIDLNASWMIGDRMTDVEAGRRAGTRTILLPGVDDREQSPYEKPDAYVPDLLTASEFILRGRSL